jgi:hypothetical protein
MNTTESIKTLVDQSKDFLETKIELTKLKAIDKSADVVSTAIVMVAIIFLGSLFVIFTSIALALMLGNWLGSAHYGFLIIGAIYGLILLVIFLQKEKWIKTPIANGLINKMLK